MTDKTSGQIALRDGYVFYWVLAPGRTPEINGHVEKPKGGVLKGSGGWYRTTSPEKAAKMASHLLPTTK